MRYTLTYTLIFSLGLFMPVVARAGTAVVNNSVQVHSTTGGNVSTGGVVVEGATNSSVSVKTVVDGKVVEAHEETSQGEPIEYAHTATGTNASVSTQVRINAGTSSLITGKSEVATAISSEKKAITTEEVVVHEESANPGPAGVEIISDVEAEPQHAAESVISKVYAFVSNVFSYVFGWL